LPFGPQDSVISTSNMACITASPAATLIANSPSPGCTSHIAHRQRDLLRQLRQHHRISSVSQTNSRYGLHKRSLSWWVFFDRITRDLPSGRPQVRDRHLKIHEDRDNLQVTVMSP
jgi:hypothetical protein